MKRLLCVALSFAMWGEAATAADWDPYAKPANEFEERLQAAAFGEPGGDRALQGWLEAHPELAAEKRLKGFHQLCDDYDALTWFRLRLAACTEYQKLSEKSASATDNAALAFADQPPARALGSATVPLEWNKFGCQSADVLVNGVKTPLFVDTGAEITVLRASLAKHMGVRVLSQKVGMSTATSDVAGQVGMIDSLEVGDAIVENVPVMILPDSQLQVPGVGQIDGLLGLQVFVAFGRMAWIDGGRKLALGEDAPRARATAPRIYWHDEGLGVPVATERGVLGAHLDTGANTSFWFQAGLPLLDPRLLANAKTKILRVGGVGGIVEQKQVELPTVSFRIGPRRISLHNVRVMGRGPVSAARIGMDAVSQFQTFILDFDQMRIDGSLKSATEEKRASKASAPK